MRINAYFDFCAYMIFSGPKYAVLHVLSYPHFVYNAITCWGTWLKTSDYYHKHSVGIKAVINSFAADKSIVVRKAQTALCNDTLEGDLAYLCAHFVFLSNIIKELEYLGATLIWNVGLPWDVQARFGTHPQWTSC